MKSTTRFAVLLGLVTLLVRPALGDDSSVFLIGNSLTWDTVPSKLDGDVKWHVDCGKSLPYMVEHPESPCVKSSTLWPDALNEQQFSVIVLQVHYGSTLAEDTEAINELLAKQPTAKIVLHTGWARSASLMEEWQSQEAEASSPMQHSRAYLEALLRQLRAQHPDRQFERTRAMDLLHKIAKDSQTRKAPIQKVEALYRDAIHMNVVTGRYLMHNAMRQALSQPRSLAGFEKIAPGMRRYLDQILDRQLNH